MSLQRRAILLGNPFTSRTFEAVFTREGLGDFEGIYVFRRRAAIDKAKYTRKAQSTLLKNSKIVVFFHGK